MSLHKSDQESDCRYGTSGNTLAVKNRAVCSIRRFAQEQALQSVPDDKPISKFVSAYLIDGKPLFHIDVTKSVLVTVFGEEIPFHWGCFLDAKGLKINGILDHYSQVHTFRRRNSRSGKTE